MASNAAETLIGAAVLVAAGGFLLYAAGTADVRAGGGQGGDYGQPSYPDNEDDIPF